MTEPEETAEEEARRLKWRRWYPLAMVYISILILSMTSIFYTGYVSRRDTHKFCDFVISLDEAFSAGPPTTQTGIRIRESIKRLRKNLNCN